MRFTSSLIDPSSPSLTIVGVYRPPLGLGTPFIKRLHTSSMAALDCAHTSSLFLGGSSPSPFAALPFLLVAKKRLTSPIIVLVFPVPGGLRTISYQREYQTASRVDSPLNQHEAFQFV